MSTVRAILRWPPVLPAALATLGFAADVQPADLIRTDAEYPGVTYDASAAEKPWREAGEPDGAGELIPEKMVAEMERLFHEAIDAYEGRKNVLPECLQDATDRLLDDLRTAEKTIRIEWGHISGDPWTDATDGAPVEMADARPAPGEPKRYLKHAIIRLWGNVSSTHWVDPRNGCAQIAAQTMLHEVFHVATFAFPDCFKDDGVARRSTTRRASPDPGDDYRSRACRTELQREVDTRRGHQSVPRRLCGGLSPGRALLRPVREDMQGSSWLPGL